MKKRTTTFFAMAATVFAFALAGCHNDKEGSEILKPIAENLIGRWEQTDGYMVDENGNKVEMEEDENSEEYVTIICFQPDGTGLQIKTLPGGWQQIGSYTWKADEEKKGFHFTGKDKEFFFPIYKLTADCFINGTEAAKDSESGEVISGSFRFEHQRIADEQTLAERLVGKWVSLKSYKKVNGEWQEAPNCRPEEGWYHFHSTGMVDGYQKFGDKEHKVEMEWSARVKNTRMRLVKGEWSDEWDFALTDADTMEIYDNETIDFITGKTITGEFKDVLVREK